MGKLLDQAAQIANLDPSFISETLTRQIMVSVTQGGDLFHDLSFFMGLSEESMDTLNYWQAGLSAGKLAKALFDININNWAIWIFVIWTLQSNHFRLVQISYSIHPS